MIVHYSQASVTPDNQDTFIKPNIDLNPLNHKAKKQKKSEKINTKVERSVIHKYNTKY